VSYAFNWFVYVAQGPSGPRFYPIQLHLIDQKVYCKNQVVRERTMTIFVVVQRNGIE